MDVWSTDITEDFESRQGLLAHAADGPLDDSQDQIGIEEIKTYKRRWYILGLFCAVGFSQGGLWNTWGPISDSAEKVFGWTDGTIALLSNWGPITYVVGIGFFTWLMDVKGLRWSAIVSSLMVAVGMGVRCITSAPPAATWLIHLGQILNGFPGPVAMGAAPLVSATWFPAHQRTTATAIGAIFNGLGVAVSFIIGPLMVDDVTESNSSWVPLENETFYPILNISNVTKSNIETVRSQIMFLMYIEFAWCAALLVLILVYFPAKPPSPPSITASIQRVNYVQGIKLLFRNQRFWILGSVYSISLGIYNCWSSVLDVNLKARNVSQEEAGWLGFYASVAGNGAGLLFAVFADIFKRRMKLYLWLLFCGATVCIGVFTAGYQLYIPFTKELMYSTLILGGICLNGGVPLIFELVCEGAYPVAEGVTNGFLTWLNNITGLIFLLILMVKNIGTTWMNWCLFGSIVICLPILCTFQEKYSRLDIDTQHKKEPLDDSGHNNVHHITTATYPE